MQGVLSDVITISSEDEVEEVPKKKRKLLNDDSGNSENVLNKLNRLPEISAFPENEVEIKMKSKTCMESDSLTIVIESEEKTVLKDKINRDTIIKPSSVVVIDDVDDIQQRRVTPHKPDGNGKIVETVILDDQPAELEDNNNELVENTNDTEDKNGVATDEDIETNSEVMLHELPSTSRASDTHKLFNKYLETCSKSLRESKYEEKLLAQFPKIKKRFANCDKIHDDNSFKNLILKLIDEAQIGAPNAVISFNELNSYLLDHVNGDGVDVTEDELKKLKKLEKICKRLMRRLKKLEEAELDFDDDADSTYIQIDRYSQRLNKVYNKYCQLLKRNPHAGRSLHDKINFASSNYDEINRAITKSYKNNQFPSYYDIEKCVRNCVEKNNLKLSDGEIKEESKNCFEKLGNVLQRKRKKDLYDVHCSLVTEDADPADEDPILKEKLQLSRNEGEKKMKEVVEKFVKLQESNVSIELSEDSDDSNYKSSDAE